MTVREALDALGPKNFSRVIWAGAIYLVLMIIQAYGRYLWRIYLIGTSHQVAKDLRRDLYEHLQKLPLSEYQKIRTGDLMSRATNDIEAVRMALGPGVLVIADAFFLFLFILPTMFYLSVKLSLLSLAFYPLVPLISYYFGKRIEKLFETLQYRMSEMSGYVQEIFSAVRLIRTQVLEPLVQNKLTRISEKYLKEGFSLSKYEAGFSPALTLITNLGTFLILLYGGWSVIESVITVGTFVAFQRFVVQLSWPMEAIGWAVTMTQEGIAAHRRILNLMELPQVVYFDANSYLESSALTPSSLLEVRDLHFTYPLASDFKLSVSHFKIKKGEKVGMVGPVGAGKTTLFQLILRLYEPTRDSIYLDDKDVRQIPLEALRKKITSVEQQIFLFSESIEKNVYLGREGDVTLSEVEAMLKVANVYEEILDLTSGVKSRLGEKGVNLSGGQKQRVAIARALARKPELILFDDCFSAVDVNVEEKIIERLLTEFSDIAFLLSSHRLSVMPRLDRILVMDKGEIVGTGTHTELLQTHRLYQALWEQTLHEKVAPKTPGSERVEL